MLKFLRKEDPLEVGNDSVVGVKKQVKLMLTPAESHALHSSARASGKDFAEYILDLHNRNHRAPTFDLTSAHELARLREAMTDLPQSVRDLHYGLLKAASRIGECFAGERASLARENRAELNEARQTLYALAEAVLPALEKLQADMIEPRQRVIEVLQAIHTEDVAD